MGSRTRRDPIAQHMAKCIHFTGIQYDQCEAGVAYAEVRDESVRPFRLPCLDSESATTCPKKVTPTREEAETWLQEVHAAFDRVTRARQAVVSDADGKIGVTGSVSCPACDGGELRYGIASNGHVRARCTTEGCVSWIE